MKEMSVLFPGCSVIALWRFYLRVASRDIWKAGIAIASMPLFLVLMVWVPVSAVGAHERAAGLAGPVKVQASPTEDATVTALNKERLKGDVAQQQHTLGVGFGVT